MSKELPDVMKEETRYGAEWRRPDDVLAFAVLTALPAQLALVDPEGVIRAVNRKWREAALALGGPGNLRKLCEGVNYLDVCARSAASGDALAARAGQGLTAVLQRELDLFSLEYPCGEAWYLMYAAPLRSLRGGVLVSHLEITDRKHREEELRRLEEWHRLVLSSTSDMISTHMPDTTFVSASGACRRLLGYEPEELVGRPILELIHPEDLERVSLVHKTLLGPSDAETVVHRLRRKDGSHVWVESAVRVMRQPGFQELEYRVGVTRDVSAHKQAEERQAELRRDLEKAAFEWRSTFDAIQSPILLLGLDGCVQRLNRAAKELLGRDYREILGLPAASLGPGQPWDTVAALARRVLESFVPEVCEATEENREKTWEVEATVSATSEGGAKVIVQIRDITKTARLQDSLRRSETMAALGAVVGGVAHEVRNPLFGMTAVLDAFESRFGDQADYRPYLPLLRTELGRMTDLMQALLDYGKPPRFEMLPREMGEAIEAALEVCRPLAERQEVSLAVLGVAAGHPVLFDLQRMAQALRNMIENAIQHSRPGGEVTIEAVPVMVEGRPWVRVSVRDRGPGFAPEDLGQILEPFFSRRSGGTGLGLSIVSRVIEGHGGTFRAGNHPEGGAVIDVQLACVRPMEDR